MGAISTAALSAVTREAAGIAARCRMKTTSAKALDRACPSTIEGRRTWCHQDIRRDHRALGAGFITT
jgi:hypothetical protein